jgi:hypothetical protein
MSSHSVPFSSLLLASSTFFMFSYPILTAGLVELLASLRLGNIYEEADQRAYVTNLNLGRNRGSSIDS